MQDTWGSIHGLGKSLEKGMATHSSILAWRIPWTEESGRLWSMGSQRVGHDWVIPIIYIYMYIYIYTLVCTWAKNVNIFINKDSSKNPDTIHFTIIMATVHCITFMCEILHVILWFSPILCDRWHSVSARMHLQEVYLLAWDNSANKFQCWEPNPGWSTPNPQILKVLLYTVSSCLKG